MNFNLAGDGSDHLFDFVYWEGNSLEGVSGGGVDFLRVLGDGAE